MLGKNAVDFRRWRLVADDHLRTHYRVSFDDLGFDDEYLSQHFASGFDPHQFTEWFARKYDLLPFGPRWEEDTEEIGRGN